MTSFVSHVDQSKTITQNNWVVSLCNTGSPIAGHAMIYVEGVENDNPFFGQYEVRTKLPVEDSMNQRIQAFTGNIQGFITEIGVIEGNKHTNPKELSDLSSRSWYAGPNEISKMVDSIKNDKQAIEKAIKDNNIHALPPYQTAGIHRLTWLGSNGGHSCLTWAEEKLNIAGLTTYWSIIDFIKSIPEQHVGDCLIQ